LICGEGNQSLLRTQKKSHGLDRWWVELSNKKNIQLSHMHINCAYNCINYEFNIVNKYKY